jgi:autotransporter passenger strand-loop-strand repeat protein
VLSGFGVAKGATVDVLSGGIASGTVVSSGGMVDVFAGGIASGGTIKSGGDATIGGGTLELGSTATASGTIDFAGGGTLKLDGTGTYGFVTSGFAVPDVFDLSAVNFISGTTSATYSGTTSRHADGDGRDPFRVDCAPGQLLGGELPPRTGGRRGHRHGRHRPTSDDGRTGGTA